MISWPLCAITVHCPRSPPCIPNQVVEIVCCRLTPLQLALYCHFLESKARPACQQLPLLLCVAVLCFNLW